MCAREHLFESRQVARRHAQRAKLQRARLLVEKSQHDALAMQRWHGGDADVHLTILEGEPDAAILRRAPFGDVEIRHHLETTDHRRRHAARRRRRFLKHTVHAIAHAERIGICLEMHVRCARLERFGKQHADEANDRRFIRERAQVVDRGSIFVRVLARTRPDGRDERLRRRFTVECPDGASRELLGDTHHLNARAEQRFQQVERVGLHIVAPHAHRQRLALDAKRNDALLLEKIGSEARGERTHLSARNCPVAHGFALGAVGTPGTGLPGVAETGGLSCGFPPTASSRPSMPRRRRSASSSVVTMCGVRNR